MSLRRRERVLGAARRLGFMSHKSRFLGAAALPATRVLASFHGECSVQHGATGMTIHLSVSMGNQIGRGRAVQQDPRRCPSAGLSGIMAGAPPVPPGGFRAAAS